MKRGIIALLFILAALLLAACGANNESAGDGSKNKSKTEFPDVIPKDFPFPDSMGLVKVSSSEMVGGGMSHIIGFTHTEDTEELYNLMKVYLEEKGCDGEEKGGQYFCYKYGGDDRIDSIKLNINVTASTVIFYE